MTLKASNRVKPPIKPHQQGDLDSFCGLYTVINAIRLASIGMFKLNDYESELLLETMLCDLERSSELYCLFNTGISPKRVERMVRVCGSLVHEWKGHRVTVERPWRRSSPPPPLSTILDTVSGHLKSAHSAALIMMDGQIFHWSVIKKMDANTIWFFDSAGYVSLPLKDTDTLPPFQTKRKYQILHHSVMLIRVQEGHHHGHE